MHQVNGEKPKPSVTPAQSTLSFGAGEAERTLLGRVRLIGARRTWLRKILGFVLLTAGLGFVARALHGQLAEFTTAAISVPGWTYAGLALLATLTVFLTAALHAEVVITAAPARVSTSRIRYAYAASQVARYAPGKVFGVILEAQMLAPAVGLRLIVAATLMQTMLVYAWAAALSCIVLGAIAMDSSELVLLGPIVLAMLWLGQRNRWLERFSVALTSWKSPPSLRPVSTNLSRRSAARITALLAMQWIPFFSMWLLLAGSSQGIVVACWLGASYLLASIGGSLLLFVPSGLVVREAAFVWLGGLYGLPAPSLMAWAIVIRLVLTAADVFAVPLLWTFQRKKELK